MSQEKISEKLCGKQIELNKPNLTKIMNVLLNLKNQIYFTTLTQTIVL